MIGSVVRALPFTLLLGAHACQLSATERERTLDDYLSLSLAELGQVKISIATANSTVFDKAPATASVIYAAEIAAMAARTLDDVLQTVPGFHVSLSTLSRMDAVYSIRGVHTGFSPQVLLLLNGVPVQFIQGAKPVLFRMPVAGIERIEVIRGPGSAIYGADAFSGVINVITKDASSSDRVQVGSRSGSFGSRDLWAEGGTRWQGWNIAFSTNYQETDGDRSRRVSADLQSRLDAAFGTQVSHAPGPLSTRYQILDTHLSLINDQFDINLWSWRSTDAGEGAGAAQALDPQGRDDNSVWMADVTYRVPIESEAWDNNIHLSYNRLRQQVQFNLLPAGAIVAVGGDGNVGSSPIAGLVEFSEGLLGNPESLMTDGILDFNSTFSGWDSHRIRAAIGTRYIDVDSGETKNFGPGVINGTEGVRDGTLVDVSNQPYVYMPDESRRVRYISLQDEWQLSQTLVLTSGIRYDHYSDFGHTTNPRLALVWSSSEDVTAKLLYGSAFRAPSFQELYFQNNPISLGNTAVNPETMDTLELAVNYRITPEFQSTLTLFSYLAQDLIEFVPDPVVSEVSPRTNTAQNARDQRAEGVEWELSWKPTSALRVVASYSWQNARDVKTHTDIADAPGRLIKVNANWEFSHNWFFNSQLYCVADRARMADDPNTPAVEDPRPEIADYTLANATLERKDIFHNLDIFLSVYNLADASAREPSNGVIVEDYPLEQRSTWLGLRYALK